MRRLRHISAAVAVVALVATACGRVLAPPVGVAPAASSTTEQGIARDLYQRLNNERFARGLPLLSYDGGLANRSQQWSTNMGSGGGFRHSDLQPLLATFTAAAENIAWTQGGTAGLVHLRFMQSDGHRHNILAPNLDVVGIGAYCAPNGTLWVTEEFGRYPWSRNPAGFGPVPSPAPIARPDLGSVSC